MNRAFRFISLLIGCAFWIFGCSASTEITPTPGLVHTPTATEAPLPSPTAQCTPYVRLTPVSPQPTPSPEAQICSPLQGIPLQELPETIFNPFNPPRPGSDDPHQGVDFADIDPLTQFAVEGRSVQAVSGGQVAGVIHDRFPYGNAIMIETTLEQLPPSWQNVIQIPDSPPQEMNVSSLTCPQVEDPDVQENAEYALYWLYAHLQSPTELHPGDQVACGQTLGQIGNSGNSLNPHLHLEARIGPAGSAFESMAHYDSSATPAEMAAYCQWRVSGKFLLQDPMSLLSPGP